VLRVLWLLKYFFLRKIDDEACSDGKEITIERVLEGSFFIAKAGGPIHTE
jgi:hypothetical protein